MTKILAWHFLADDGRLKRYERPDGTFTRRTLVKPGMTFRLPKGVQPKLCQVGFHGSIRALDALGYATGSICCRTEHSGLVVTCEDKICSSVRKVLWMADATYTLHEFGCWCAEQALLRERAAGREPDPRSWAAVEAKRRWLRGEITDNELTWAASAAWDAAETWAAAGAASAAMVGVSDTAARASAEAAAGAAAAARARAAAGAAAAARARAAAWAAALSDLNTELERRLLELAGKEGKA